MIYNKKSKWPRIDCINDIPNALYNDVNFKYEYMIKYQSSCMSYEDHMVCIYNNLYADTEVDMTKNKK